MADTCYCTIFFRKEDKEKIKAAIEADGDPLHIDMEWEDHLDMPDVPWAGHGWWERISARTPGIPWIVEHGNSYDWDAGYYAWDGETMHFGTSTQDGLPVVGITADGREIWRDEVENYYRVKEMLNG